MILKFIKLKGFTLIELMVVIGVIAILSTLAFVFFNTIRMNSRDARRLADVKQIQNALKMYYNDVGFYPTAITANGSIANGGTNYLLRIPSNPVPRNDNNCADQDYKYTQLENGQRYTLSFCLGDKTDEYNSGSHDATANGILNCPVGYVAVPGSSELNTNDFCVMKYEPKCADNTDLTTGLSLPEIDTGSHTYNGATLTCTTDVTNRTVVSVASGYPIGNVTKEMAVNYCNGIGEHLITNNEWMTITRNAEKVANADLAYSNWEGGAIGSGAMPRGVREGGEAQEAIEEKFIILHTSSEVEARRTLILSTGEKIWDLAGNVSEWVEGPSCVTGSGVGKYLSETAGAIGWDSADLDDYERGVSGPSSNTYYGLGQYYGCRDDADENHVIFRGGSADVTEYAGAYALALNKFGEDFSPLWGFRCVKN